MQLGGKKKYEVNHIAQGTFNSTIRFENEFNTE
jgi:hypothetical protein